jgi:hypothetical protein
MVAAKTMTIDSAAPSVQTVVSVETMGAVVTSYSIDMGANTVTIVDTATSVSSVYTSTMQVQSVRRSTVTAVRSVSPSTVTVGAVTVTSDVVVPSGYITITDSRGTITTTLASGITTVTESVVTASGSSTITSGISTVTMKAGPVSFMTVYRRDEKSMKDDKTEEELEINQDKKKEIASVRFWIAFDGLTEMWM